MRLRFVAPTLAVCLLGGSASAAEAPDAPRLSPLWSKAVSEPAGASVLLPANGRLAALTWQGDVVVLDADTGRRLWRKRPPQRGAVVRPQLAVDGERVIVTWPGEAKVFAYRLADGREAWTTPLTGIVAGMADCARHRAVIVTHRGMGTLVASAIDPKNGALLWRAPVPGPVVGAGDAYVFTETPSGFGVWPGRLAAVHCATGAVTPLSDADRQLVRFMAAGSGVAVGRHLDPGFARERVCLHRLSAVTDDVPSSVCLDAGDDETPAHPLTGALVVDDTVYFSTAHITAHNLDASPDSWVFARALDGQPRWRSPALVSRAAPVYAGDLLWTGFGSTDADDYAYLLDRADGQPVGRLALRKAPTALAADRERAYVSTYDGRIHAVRLPRPAPMPMVRKPVSADPGAAVTTAIDTGPWHHLETIDAHPKTARSSGSARPGTASPIAFVDAAGTRVAVGGNDDKVRIFDVATGRRLWISKPLGKDVEALAIGGDRVHARIYGGRSFVFEPSGTGWRSAARITHAHGWMSGLTGDGRTVVSDAFDGTVSAHDAGTGKKRWATSIQTTFDQRGVRIVGQRMVVHDGSALRVLDVGDIAATQSATRDVPKSAEGGAMTQAWMIDETHGAWEYCGPERCVVEIGRLAGAPEDEPTVKRTFDTRGAGWVPSVPSTLEISADRRWLFFFRLGLEPLVVEIDTNRRIPLGAITEQPPGDYTTARFSADSSRLALGMHPASWQVTVIEKR